jgi:hypothetical protein
MTFEGLERKALDNHCWTRHFRHGLTPVALIQAVELWEQAQHVRLQHNIDDTVSWRWTESRFYTAASAYTIQFEGAAQRDYKMPIWASDDHVEVLTCCCDVLHLHLHK